MEVIILSSLLLKFLLPSWLLVKVGQLKIQKIFTKEADKGTRRIEKFHSFYYSTHAAT